MQHNVSQYKSMHTLSWRLLVLHTQATAVFDKIVSDCLYFVACSQLHILVVVLYFVEVWMIRIFYFMCTLTNVQAYMIAYTDNQTHEQVYMLIYIYIYIYIYRQPIIP